MAALDTGASTPVDTDSKANPVKPEKPDEEQYKIALDKAKKELAAAQEATKAAQEKVNLARGGNKDSPVSQRQQELRAQLASIKQKQSGLKTSRTSVQDKIKLIDTQLKARINDQKAAKSKIPFKSVDEVDREIQKLEKQVDSGTMKLVDEKKTLADITALRKQRKAFSGFDDAQKNIDDLKAQIAELKKSYDDPESKALSDEFSAAAKELDEIKAQQDGAFKSLNASRDNLTKARAVQDQKYAAVKAIQDKYYSDKRAFHDYDREASRLRALRRKAENDAYHRERRRKDALEALEEASTPAYVDEIRTARNLLQRVDPTYVPPAAASTSGKFAASAQRTVDAGEFQGTKLAKKGVDQEDYFQGTGGKKGKKGKKTAGEATSSGSTSSKVDLGFFMNPGVLKDISYLELNVPSSQSEIAGVIEKLKEKLNFYESDRDRKTKENIANAQSAIDKAEAEANEADRKPAAPLSSTNGTPSAKEANLTETTEKLAGTSLDVDAKETNPETGDIAKPASETNA